ncbi:MAG: tRNA (adenosine(37)-N6)-threonylcarbamoyltransferase complex ATPase subunit type 1 TsaE [Chloroflexi bacterium]|nr:tRNA (adenosine(37)-N6)-threonylcarbamoyltransferase complex ATPase subunit type 1 TsaE [Chloroflexota bacterium]
MEIVTRSSEETQRLARAIGEACRGGELLLLSGELGAGKTSFVQGLARGLDIEEYVHSPTFVLVAEYHGRLTLYHADLYRIESAGEAADLGLDDYFRPDAVCAVEWAEKTPGVFPGDHLRVAIEHLGGDRRRIAIDASGQRHATLLRTVAAARTTA